MFSDTLWIALAISLPLGYLLGAVPFGHLAGRLRGVDMRTTGTGNPGAANIFRKVDRRLGLAVGAADIAKGAAAVLLGRWLGLPTEMAVLPGATAVLGHWHSPFLGFQGGAGLAVAVGVGVGMVPLPGAFGAATALAFILLRRNVGVGAGFGYAAAVIAGLALREPVWLLVEATLLGILVLVRSQVLQRR
ncbi:MAG: glycerol-3-phosphate acyltransferase [Chloroflexota bacterium]|nr:glycerol-3-phosphate acyltransferase [Chloroflexota bacterium]